MSSIFHRTSIRRYQARPVEEEKIEMILRAGMQAPSAMNGQPWEFYVVTDPEKIRECSHATPHSSPCSTAAVVFVPCWKEECRLPQFAHIDMSACVENMLLMADELGLGACWMAVAPNPQVIENVAKVIGISEELIPFALISCGYPDEEKEQQSRYDSARVHRI